METVQHSIEARAKLNDIRQKKATIQTKVFLLESLKQNLKVLYERQSLQTEKSKLETNSTFFTDIKSVISREQQETMIEKILRKQKLKIEMDQEIQTCEDDLLEIERVVETKQLYAEKLNFKIAKKTKEMDEQSRKIAQLQKVKSTPSLLKKIFG